MTREERTSEIARRIREQHGHLRGTLVELAQAATTLRDSENVPAVVLRVAVAADAARDELVRHFSSEERLELHSELAAILPDKSELIRILGQEHGVLRSMICGCEEVASRCTDADVLGLLERIEEFLLRLHQHESTEEQLMDKALHRLKSLRPISGRPGSD